MWVIFLDELSGSLGTRSASNFYSTFFWLKKLLVKAETKIYVDKLFFSLFYFVVESNYISISYQLESHIIYNSSEILLKPTNQFQYHPDRKKHICKNYLYI